MATVKDKERIVEDNEGWKKFNRRRRNSDRRGRMDTEGSLWKGSGSEVVSFYFLEFPDSHRAKDMFRIFGLYGKVVDVVIPRKLNKWGKGLALLGFKM